MRSSRLTAANCITKLHQKRRYSGFDFSMKIKFVASFIDRKSFLFLTDVSMNSNEFVTLFQK